MRYNFIKKIQKSLLVAVFALMLLGSFILINTSGGVLFSSRRLDLTADKLNTLSPRTEEIISQIKEPLTVKIYLSSQISRNNPMLAQYAQNVIRLLQHYQDKSGQLMRFEILDPKPFSAVETEAQNAGLQALSDNETEKSYFGAVFSNNKGKSYSIAQFMPERFSYLENDLSRAVSHILMPKKRTLGIASNLPIFDPTYSGQKQKKDWTAINLLKKDYQLQEVSLGSAEIPDVDAMLVVASGNLPSIFVYALDQYIMRGGRLLLIVDPVSELELRLNPHSITEYHNLTALLDNIGIKYLPEKVVGDRELTAQARFSANKDEEGALQNYYPWLKINAAHINQKSPITQGLNSFFLKSAGAMEIFSQDNHTVTELLGTSDNTLLVADRLAKLGYKADVMRYMEVSNKHYSLAALSQGEYHTIFSKNPLEETALANQILPFLETSISPSQIIVISDSDILDVQNWTTGENVSDYAQDDYNLFPLNNNFDLILRSVDFLSGNQAMLNIADKKFSGSRQTIAQIFYQQEMQKQNAEYKATSERLDYEQRKLDTINIMLQNNAAFGTAKTLGEIDALKEKIQKEEGELRRIEYQVKARVESREHAIALINTLIFPILILLLIAAVQSWFSRRTRKQARSLTHE